VPAPRAASSSRCPAGRRPPSGRGHPDTPDRPPRPSPSWSCPSRPSRKRTRSFASVRSPFNPKRSDWKA